MSADQIFFTQALRVPVSPVQSTVTTLIKCNQTNKPPHIQQCNDSQLSMTSAVNKHFSLLSNFDFFGGEGDLLASRKSKSNFQPKFHLHLVKYQKVDRTWLRSVHRGPATVPTAVDRRGKVRSSPHPLSVVDPGFPRGGGAKPRGKGPNLLFGQFFPKTA